jgi:predicted CoA-binding protein
MANSSEPEDLLRSARIILLVDWPSVAVPRALLAAGFHVFGSSPTGYSRAELVPEPPGDADGVRVFAPEPPAERDYLVFRRIAEAPPRVDIVSVFRPAEELPGIVAQRVVPLHAGVLWLHPPIASPDAATLATQHGFKLVEGRDIAAVARQVTLSGR